MNGRMDGWMDEWRELSKDYDGGKDRKMDGWREGGIDKLMEGGR